MKLKLKHRKKISKGKIILWVFILVIVFSLFLLHIISKKINPIIFRYASVETKRFTKALINASIDEEVLSSIDQNLFSVTKSSEGDIQSIDFNAKEVNVLLNLIADKIEKNMLKVEEGDVSQLKVAKAFKGINFPNIKKGVVCEVPVGVLFGNALFSNMGPVIPVKFSFIGQVLTNLNTKVKTYGINNAYLELYVHIEVSERITMPLMVEEQTVKLDVPLTMKVIQGKVPTYFQSGLSENSPLFTLPIKE